MKKFTKFLGIFLALSMVIGMLSVVGAVDPETPTAPAAPTGAILQGTTYEVVSPTRIETLFGFYEDGTGEDEDTFLDCEDGACVTDGWFGRAGYSECTSDDGLIALIMMVDDFINLGAIEIVAKDQGHRAVNFEIQVMGDADWETVVTADNDPLADCLTKTFTFDAVETDTVRILITEVGPATDDDAGQCYFNEVTLFEAGTGNLKTVIDMNGKVTASNANTSDCTNNAVDGDKSTMFTGSWMTVDLGEATAIDGFNLYHYRNSSYPNNITVSIQQTEGGEFVEIGTFATGFTSGAPVDSLYVTFDQTYMAYAITFGSDVWGYQNDYELWQYQREATEEPTEEPTPAPTEEPTPAPTEAPAPEYTWIDLIPESQLTPHVGYYVGDDFTTLTDEYHSEAELLTDAHVGSAAWVHGTTFPIPSGNTPAAVVEVGTEKIIAGVKMCSRIGQEVTDFVVEVLNTNNEWVTVNTTTSNADNDVEIIFDTAVIGTAVRVIINDWNGDHPMIVELWIYEGKTGDTLVEIPVTNVTASQTPVVPDQGVEKVVDSNGYTYYQIGAGNMPVAINFDTTNADGSATNVSRLRIYAFRADRNAAKDIVVDVRTGEETWETVYTGTAYELGHTDSFVLDFGATYAAFDVRLTINTVTAENLVLTEVELFGNGEPVAPPAVTPTEPTEPETQPTEPTVIVGPDGVVNEIVLGALSPVGSMGIVPQFGYYDNAEMIGSVIDHQAAPGEDACLVDGNTGNSGWTGNIAFADLVDNGGVKVPVILLDLGAATTVGGIELISVDSSCSAPTHFEVQVTTSADSDVWETVLTAENVTWNRTETKQFAFDRTVDAYKVRLVVYNLSALGEATETQFALHELTLMSAQEVPKVDKAPLSGSNVLQFGYFADLELTDYRDSVLSNNVPGNLFDGNSGSLAITNTEAWTWGSGAGMAANGGTNTAVLTLDVTQNGEPTAINYMQMVVQGQYRYAPTTYTLQVTTSATEDNWTTVYEVTDFSWEDNGSSDHYVTFDEVSAYKVRLLVAKTHVDQNNLCYFGMGEFILGTVEIVDIPDDPTDPTDPTTPSEPEPTTPSEPEPTVPSEPAEALPEAPVVLPGTTTIENGVAKEGTVYKKIPYANFTAQFGYYDANSNFVDGNDGSCCIDGWYGRAGYSECTTSQGQMALILTSTETKLIGRVEIVARVERLGNAPAAFDIQAMVNGEWVTVHSVTENPFTTTATVAYTFPAVETNQIRLLIHSVATATEFCHINAVEVYEVTTGKIYNNIDLIGKVTASDAFGNNPASNLVDGDKSTNTTGANYTINLTGADGEPTSIDGFRLYFHRGDNTFAMNASIMVQTAPGGEFVSIGSFPTGWNNGNHNEVPVVEFDQTYVAYAVQLNLDVAGPLNEFQLFQYEKEPAPVVPEDPTEPSVPVEPTEPSVPVEPTEPSVPAEPTEPSVPAEPTTPSEPSDEPIIPGDDLDYTELDATFELLDTLNPEDYTEESMLAFEEAFAEILLILMDENLTQEMVDEANEMLLAAIDALVLIDEPGDEPGTDLPPVPELPGLNVDITELQATIDLIHGLNPNEYTEDSYAELIAAVKEVNKMIAYGGGYTQAVIDRANEMLTTALDNLVKIDGGSADIPGIGDGDGDSDLPADTGDIALTVMTAMMTMSAVGGAVVVGKKKFF